MKHSYDAHCPSFRRPFWKQKLVTSNSDTLQWNTFLRCASSPRRSLSNEIFLRYASTRVPSGNKNYWQARNRSLFIETFLGCLSTLPSFWRQKLVTSKQSVALQWNIPTMWVNLMSLQKTNINDKQAIGHSPMNHSYDVRWPDVPSENKY